MFPHPVLQTFRASALAVAGSLGLHGCATLPGQESTTQVVQCGPVW
jgi:hypothetical protein